MKNFLGIILLSLLLTGCNTWTTSKKEWTIVINTTPEAALVLENNKTIGTAPLVLKAVEGSIHTYTLFKPGHIPVKLQLSAGATANIELNTQNGRLVTLFETTKSRFVYREGLGVMLEPVNRPVQVGVNYLVTDPASTNNVQFTVVAVTSRYVELISEGHSIYLPIISN